MAEKCARTDRSDREMDTEGGGEECTSQSHTKRHKKGYLMSIYLTNSDMEAIMDFAKHHG